MKKKLSFMLCLIVMVLGLTACGMDKETFDFYGLTYSDCETIMSQNVNVLTSIGEEELAYLQASQGEAYAKLFSNWAAYAPEAGAYQGLGEFSLDQTQDTLTLEQIINFENRDLCMTFVLEYNYEMKKVDMVDANVDLVYTLGEKMTKAGLNTLMGMGTVFAVLILISLIIYCFRYISIVQNKMVGNKKQASEAEVTAVQTEQCEQQLTDNLELVAVISAAIAVSEGTSADSFVVRSIHRR